MEVPMLEEDEWEEVQRAHVAARETTSVANSSQNLFERLFAPLLEAYERITGFAESNPNAVFHHRVSLYGPPCSTCGKPLRTPEAKWCAACGATP